MNNIFQSKSLNVGQQILKLVKYWNSGEVIFQSHKTFEWCCKVKPTSLSREYEMTIIYKLNYRPQVYIRKDDLWKVKDGKIPHIYKCEENRVEICLYFGNEFKTSMYISDTIVPWAIEWLFYYEIWLITGTWLGGGIHPADCKNQIVDYEKRT